MGHRKPEAMRSYSIICIIAFATLCAAVTATSTVKILEVDELHDDRATEAHRQPQIHAIRDDLAEAANTGASTEQMKKRYQDDNPSHEQMKKRYQDENPSYERVYSNPWPSTDADREGSGAYDHAHRPYAHAEISGPGGMP